MGASQTKEQQQTETTINSVDEESTPQVDIVQQQPKKLTREEVKALIQQDAQSSVQQFVQRYSKSKTMYAVIYEKYGGPSVLEMRDDVQIPELDDKRRVLIQVHFASVNPVDYKIRAGYLRMFYKALFPMIPGQDAAGIVVKSSTDNFKEGDRVFGYVESGRTFAEYAACDPAELATVPDEMSLAEASCLPTVGLATYQSLVQQGGLQVALNDEATEADEKKKKKVLIIGSSGGVGSFAVQYAKRVLNAEVHATCSSRNSSYVKDLGADFIYEYDTDPDYTKLVPQMDIIMDNVGGDDIRKKTWSLLKAKRGKYLQLGVANQSVTYGAGSSTGALLVWRKVTSSLRLSPSYHMIATKPNGQMLSQIADHYIQTKMTPGHITRCYQLNAKNAALTHVLTESRRTRGKIIMQVCDSIGRGESHLNTLFLSKYLSGHNTTTAPSETK